MIIITVIELKKEFLNSYLKQCNKIRSLQEQKSSIIEEIISARAQNYSDMPKSNKKSDLSDSMVVLENIVNEINDEQAKRLAIKIEIESSILRVNDGIECSVLHKRYIMLKDCDQKRWKQKDWEEIASELSYSVKHVHNIHGRALQHIEIGGIYENNCS